MKRDTGLFQLGLFFVAIGCVKLVLYVAFTGARPELRKKGNKGKEKANVNKSRKKGRKK